MSTISRRITIAAITLTLGAAAAAQQGGQRRGWGGAGGSFEPRQWLDQMLTGFDRELGFDEMQWALLDDVVTAQVERSHVAMEQWREIGEAMAAGDEARAAELRAELRRGVEEREGGMQVMFNDIETVLYEDQLVRFRDMRQLMQEWRDHGREMWQAVREIPDAVGMTEVQREEYRAMLRVRWEAMQEEMRLRWERGDEGLLWERPDFAALRDDFYQRVGALLDEDQRQLLSDYRMQRAGGAAPAEHEPPEDVRKVLRAMKRVKGLSDAQFDALREIEREAQQVYGEVRRDEEQSAELAAEVKGRILDVLNAEQRVDFQAAVDRLHGRRGEERTRGERGSK